jgi:hypothetical protein
MLVLALSRLLSTVPSNLRRIALFAVIACLVLGGSSLKLYAGDHGPRYDDPGYVDRLEIVSTYPAYGGASFGNVGPYTVIVAIAHNKLDPNHPANAGIVDVKLAPRDGNGMVDYSEDVVILRPTSAANAKRVLFYDVVNRGGKVATGTFNGAGATFAAGQQGNALLLRLGYTIVFSGWQGNVLQTGQGDISVVGTNFPVATQPDGSPINGEVREEFILDALDPSNGPGLAANGVATVGLVNPAATLDQSGVTFNWRQTWLVAPGVEDYNSPSTPVPSATWSFVDGGNAVQFTPPAGTDLGTIYTFIYTATAPKVMGLGFSAIRDLITFLNHDRTDHHGNPNPVWGIRSARCERNDCDRDSVFEVRMMEGISQSGRFTRDFLYQGFNNDARASERFNNDVRASGNGDSRHTVFNGMFPIIPASRKTYTNFRWSQPGRWSKQHEDHWQPGDQFPFAYQVITDPVSGRTDGILKDCLETKTCPKIIHLIGGFETWGGRDALVTTDGRGHDIGLPENVREYVVPGANHGGGGGVATIPTLSPIDKYPISVVVESTIDRALAPVLEEWVAKDVSPPASVYPSKANGLAAPPADQSGVGFPDLSSLGIAYPAGLYSPLVVTKYSTGGIPSPDLSKNYTVLVSKTDSDGNELAGVRVPEVVAPLATYTSWNIRTTGHAPGDGGYYLGSTFVFASTEAERIANRDPRPSLAARYSSKADYVNQVQAAAEALVKQRLLLQEDVQVYVDAAQSQTILP